MPLGTIEKVGQVLDLFTEQRQEWGTTEVAQALGWPKPSAHHVLASLSTIGLLRRTDTRRYRLGYRAISMSRVVLRTTPWREAAQDELLTLAGFGESVQIGALDGGRLVCMAAQPGTLPRSVRVAEVGTSIPPHCSANGKVLLASFSEDRTREIIGPAGLRAFTPNTITTFDELWSELARVTERGFATDVEEYRAGMCSVGAPIRDHRGHVVASISVATPAERFYDRKAAYRTAVIRVAERISLRIGFDLD